MAWNKKTNTPENLAHALDRGEASFVPVRTTPTGQKQAQCPGCNLWRPVFTLVNVEVLPNKITNGQKWACDGCRSIWQREKLITGLETMKLHKGEA